jgi:hypothetical protein
MGYWQRLQPGQSPVRATTRHIRGRTIRHHGRQDPALLHRAASRGRRVRPVAAGAARPDVCAGPTGAPAALLARLAHATGALRRRGRGHPADSLHGAGGPFNLAADDTLDTAALAAGIGGRVAAVPKPPVLGLAWCAWRAGLLPIHPGWLRLADQATLVDTGRARSELGWLPSRSAASALAELVAGLWEGAGSGSAPLQPYELHGLGERVRSVRWGVPSHQAQSPAVSGCGDSATDVNRAPLSQPRSPRHHAWDRDAIRRAADRVEQVVERHAPASPRPSVAATSQNPKICTTTMSSAVPSARAPRPSTSNCSSVRCPASGGPTHPSAAATWQAPQLTPAARCTAAPSTIGPSASLHDRIYS